jgi:hypothetical protein
MNWTQIIRTVGNFGPIEEFFRSNGYSEIFEKYADSALKEAEKNKKKNNDELQKKRRRTLALKIKKFEKRLQEFLNTGIWKIRKEFRMSSSDEELQTLLINLTKEENLINTQKKMYNVQIETPTGLLNECRERIRKELKQRELKRDKRKIAFLLEP